MRLIVLGGFNIGMSDSKGILVQIKEKENVSSSVLVSHVKRLDEKINYYDFFSQYQHYKGERFFWKDPSSENILVGIGVCEKIECVGSNNHYKHVQEKWNELLNQAIIENEFENSGIGPILLGGFSFDPQHEKSTLWNGFSDGYFFVPSMMLSEIEGNQYLTINCLIPREDIENAHYEIESKLHELSSNIVKSPFISENKRINFTELNGQQWKQTVRNVISRLDSELKKVVLAREAKVTFSNTIETEFVLKNLIEQQKNGYIFALESQNKCFLGATPERLVKKEGETVYSACLAGSIPRGRDLEEDQRLEQELLHDSKNRIEHNYVVEMIRNAMELVCEKIVIPSEPQVLKMRDIQHLFTPVSGVVKKSESIFSIIKRLHPTPALGGFPQDKALKIIREEENLDRGLYGSPLGWLDYKGNGEYAVSIRSGVINGKEANIFAGCGIVADSDVDLEFKETAIKFKPMLSALGGNTE